MNLKLALPNGRILKVKTNFPYRGSPLGYRVLLEGKTAIVVGFADEGEEVSLSFPDSLPLTTEKHIKALVDTALHYSLNPWLLLHKLLPSAFDWREEEYIVLSGKSLSYLDKESLEILSWVKKRRRVKEENLKKRFGDKAIKYLIELGFLTRIREWKVPNLSQKVYKLSLPIEEALQRLKNLKNKEDVIRLLYFLLERRYVSQEELKEQGFRSEQVKTLIKKGIVVQLEEEISQISYNPAKLKQETRAFLKPLGNKTLLMGSWQGISERLFEELQVHIKRKESVFLFCDHVELLMDFYNKIYPLIGDRLLLLSSLQKEKDFVKNWFRAYEEEGLVVLGSRVSLLSPIKNLGLVVLLGDGVPKLQDGTDLRYFLFELSRYYGAKFCVASPLPPVGLCLKDSWEKEVFEPSAEIIVIRRKPEEVLAPDTIELLKNSLQEESLILVNKVGYAYAYCKACGYVIECPKCGSFLTLSKDKKTLFCNSCRYKGIALCPECGRELSELGFGIEKAVEEVSRLFKTDSIHFGTVPELKRVYDNVFVLHADNILSVPWYDSSENYFSYLWKALSISKKRLVVQTVIEHNPLLEFLKQKDWEGFCKEELNRRKEENLPPFSRLIKIQVSKEPKLSHLPVEVSVKNLGKIKEMLIKVDHKNFSSVLKFLRSLRPISLQVL